MLGLYYNNASIHWLNALYPSALFPVSPTKRRMQNIGNVSILGMFIMYFLTAIFGYLTFYGKAMSLSEICKS